MVDLVNSSFIDWFSRNSNTSESDDVEPDNQINSTIIIVGIFASVLIAIILISYRVFYQFCMNRKQNNRRQSICSRGISSIYVVPVRRSTISDSRDVSSIYPVSVRSNTVSYTREESPPCYHSVVHLQEGQSDSIARF